MIEGVKAGVLQFFSWPERRVPIETVYARALERIEIMDRSGYDAVWLAEHHFSGFSVCPSIHMVGALVAARTRNLRIGTGVSLAPFYHPLRLAEEVALLDVLSGGRVNWGVGRGFQRLEFDAFGVDMKDSYDVFREHLQLVLEAWTNERVSYRGVEVEVLPKPLQQPHPPVWLAASSPTAIEWAGESGYDIMLDPHSAFEQITAKRELYRETLEQHGHSIAGRDLPMARLLAVAETEREAEEIARQGARWTVGAYIKPEISKGFDMDANDPVEHYVKHVALHGTPESLVDRIAQLREEMFLDYLLCAPLSHKSFELFTDKVLPQIG